MDTTYSKSSFVKPVVNQGYTELAFPELSVVKLSEVIKA